MYKKTNNLTVNTIIVNKKTNKEYRVLYFENEDLMIVIELKVSKLNIFYFSRQQVLNELYTTYEIYTDDNNMIVDLDKLNDVQMQKYTNKLNFVNEVQKAYGPTFIELVGKSTKEDFVKSSKTYNLKKTTAWTTIRRYLQSGLSKSSLIDKPKSKEKKSRTYEYKPGKKSEKNQGIIVDDKVKKQFQTALNEFKNNRNMSFQLAFDKLILLNYSKTSSDGNGFELVPEDERPTFRQFYYYCQKHMTREEMIKIKTSQQEYRNNNRLLLSESNYMVSGPGDMLEMDAQEMDITIVSEYDRNQVIGRPILYGLIDVYTHAIVAISVGFDNNSIIGMTNCLLNLAEDKNEYLKRNGLPEINLDYWPSNFLPRHIRVDRGSDFVSQEAEKIFNELNIQRVVVPGATGSYKGYIEQLWHQLNSAQNAVLYNNGLIEKRYDSTHKQKAVLTMSDVTKIVISQVVVYNQLQLKNYKPTKDMLKNNIEPSPCSLWKYGVEKLGKPVPILDLKQYAYTLMTKAKATISRKGVCVNGLYYISDDKSFINKMILTGTKKVAFDCRYDTRNISTLYYLENNQLKELHLDLNIKSQIDFVNATLTERLDYLKATRQLFSKGESNDQRLKSARIGMIDAIVNNAKQLTPDEPRNNKNVREKRKEEQMIHQNNNGISTVLLNEDKNNVPKLEEPSTKTINEEHKIEQQEDLDTIEALIQADYEFGLSENEDF